MNEEQYAAHFMAVAEQISKMAPVAFDATGAALIAAIHFGIGSDSRSLSNKLGIAHALVLRGITALSVRFVTVKKRDERTQRTWVELTDEASALALSASKMVLNHPLSAS